MTDRRPHPWLSLIVWLLPAHPVKNTLLRLLGNRIGERVRVGPALVLGCGSFAFAPDSAMGSFNIFRRLAAVELGRGSYIGNFNQFTAAVDYQKFSPLVGRLMLGELAIITNRHYFDCSGQIILGDRAGVGGVRSILQSHEIDLAEDRTTVGRIELGDRAMSGTACVLLKDAYLPERCVLAAGSVLTKAKDPAGMAVSSLYGGAPAKVLRELSGFAWWDREGYNTPVGAFDDSAFRLP